MNKEETTYHIKVSVRDENGKILNSPSDNLKRPSLQCHIRTNDVDHLQFRMEDMAAVLRAWLPKDYSINIEASVYMNVSGDGYYMNMFSYYESEDRFVKHK